MKNICIDDFSYRKRYSYGTVMVDIETHRIVDMLDSREVSNVAQWLGTFPNLSIVLRDGSVSYNKAIKDAGKNITQISDRFHLLKGLTDAAKTHITQLISSNIGLPVSASHYDGTETTDYWDKPIKDDWVTRTHNENLKKKQALVAKARELQKSGFKRSIIARELGISYATAVKYLNPDYNPVNSRYHTTLPSPLKVYEKTIIKMLGKGCKFKEIEAAIREKGYNGAASTIRMFATRERKLLKQAREANEGPVEKIERKWLISLLYKPVDDVKGISQEQLDKVIDRFPEIGKLYDCVKSFKETLFSKKPDELEKWITEARALNITEIDSFINGMERDIIAVKHAIALKFNNGLAEGSVNKIKVIKRIMYGRCSHDMLRAKLLRLEARHSLRHFTN